MRIAKVFVWVGDILISHAGVTLQTFLGEQPTVQEVKAFTHPGFSGIQKYFKVGRSRGGNYPYGGPFWCDAIADFQPLTNVPQVFGHTRGGPHKIGNSLGIDMLDTSNNVALLKGDNPDWKDTEIISLL